MKIVLYILNLPWTLIGFLVGLLSVPERINLRSGWTILIKVKNLWLCEIFMGRMVGGVTIGNTILLSKFSEVSTLEHEKVHVKQYERFPSIFPFLYIYEFLKKDIVIINMKLKLED